MNHKVSALRRSLSLFHATMYGIGLILEAGIYVIIGDAAEVAGNLLWISLLFRLSLQFVLHLVMQNYHQFFQKVLQNIYIKNSFGKLYLSIFVGCLTNICKYNFSFCSCNRIFELSFSFCASTSYNSFFNIYSIYFIYH